MPQKALWKTSFCCFGFVVMFCFLVVVGGSVAIPTTTKRQHQNKTTKQTQTKQQREGLGCCGALQAPHRPTPSKTQTKPKPTKTHKIKKQTHTHIPQENKNNQHKNDRPKLKLQKKEETWNQTLRKNTREINGQRGRSKVNIVLTFDLPPLFCTIYVDHRSTPKPILLQENEKLDQFAT